MKTNLRRQRFLNWVAKCGWYPIDVKTSGETEIRVYLTPRGTFVRIKMNAEEVLSVEQVQETPNK